MRRERLGRVGDGRQFLAYWFCTFFALFDYFDQERYVGEDFSACPRQIRPACASQVPREGAVRDTSRDALRALSPSTCVASRKFLARRLPRGRARASAPASRAAMAVAPVRFTPPSTSRPQNWLCPPAPAMCFFPARLRRARLGAPPGFDRAESRPIVAATFPGRESERTRRRARSAHEDSTRGSPPIPGQRSLQGRPRSRVRGHDRVTSRRFAARRPGAPRASPRFPRVMRARLVPRDSRTPFSRGRLPAARAPASQLERRPARRNFSRLFLASRSTRD